MCNGFFVPNISATIYLPLRRTLLRSYRYSAFKNLSGMKCKYKIESYKNAAIGYCSG
ncbi:MAG: hypothetical protein JWR72_3734 [Flavisolibacter sp.]|jgi:hypothetical protein|nr:hypothetical protein [Flavisolibacter sp.]